MLEQIVDDYLNFKGYFTIHNVPFHPDKQRRDYSSRDDAVPSDIDVIGINPKKRGTARVVAVTCKSWQGGFDAERLLAQMRGEGKTRRGRYGATSESCGSRNGARRSAERSRSGPAREPSITASPSPG